MSVDWAKEAAEWFGEQPSPHAPGLKNKEVATAVRVATVLKHGGHADMAAASAFWGEYQGMNARLTAQGKEPVSPDEFEHLVGRVAPLSFAYHGKPPTMHELV